MSVNWVSNGSDNGLSPILCQAIIWTNAGILSISHLGTNFSEILIKIQQFSFTKMHLKILSANASHFPGGDELILVVLRVEYSGLSRSIRCSWCRIDASKDFNYLCHWVTRNDRICKFIPMFPSYVLWYLRPRFSLVQLFGLLSDWHQIMNSSWPTFLDSVSI